MNYLPLPNELLRKVYQYIHPAFDYCMYRTALDRNRKEELIFKNMTECISNNMCSKARIEYNNKLSQHLLMMNTNLTILSEFISNNPLFKRPYECKDLSEYQHKTALSNDYCENQIYRMEKNIWIRRGLWGNIKSKGLEDVIIRHDIVYILHSGSLDEIKIACELNNISISRPFMNPFSTQYEKNTHIRHHLIRKLMKA